MYWSDWARAAVNFGHSYCAVLPDIYIPFFHPYRLAKQWSFFGWDHRAESMHGQLRKPHQRSIHRLRVGAQARLQPFTWELMLASCRDFLTFAFHTRGNLPAMGHRGMTLNRETESNTTRS